MVVLEAIVLWANYAVLVYFLLLNGFYLVLYTISFFEISDYTRRELYSGVPELFGSNYAPPVSLIVPAYNEEATITASVRSFLSLQYPLFEVVV
ncbi:MAG: glycosyltransferase, partial [Rubrobacteraceae bacterium]